MHGVSRRCLNSCRSSSHILGHVAFSLEFPKIRRTNGRRDRVNVSLQSKSTISIRKKM